MEETGIQNQTLYVDRQSIGLLNASVWANVIVALALIAVNVINYMRAEAGSDTLVSFATPGLTMLVSVALCVWMAYNCFGMLASKARLKRVFIACREDCVEGVSLPDPTSGRPSKPFSLTYGKIRYVGVVETALTKKHTAPSLKICDSENDYIVPAPERIDEIVRYIAERMPGSYNKNEDIF